MPSDAPLSDLGRSFTAPEAARLLKIAPSKLRRLIESGELLASNVALREGGLPRWRLFERDLLDFLHRRQPQPSPRLNRRRRRPSDIVEFIKP